LLWQRVRELHFQKPASASPISDRVQEIDTDLSEEYSEKRTNYEYLRNVALFFLIFDIAALFDFMGYGRTAWE
jgi:hypothetical protein